jgi:hypothetical protein
MNCPTCGKPARPGTVSLQLSGWGQAVNVLNLFEPASTIHIYHHVYFTPADGGEAVLAVSAQDVKQSFHCEPCGTLLVVSKKPPA